MHMHPEVRRHALEPEAIADTLDDSSLFRFPAAKSDSGLGGSPVLQQVRAHCDGPTAG